jgi:predicted unusual protein kinase regulating ubiquinone biosynthesis (AarF/ABC1/UbiB family)
VTHGDLHAGNVIFIKNNEPPMYQLGLIDFGIVTRIEKNITRLLLNVASNLNNSTFSLSEMILNDLIEPRQSFLELPNKDFILNEISNLINETLNTPKNMNQVRLFEGLKKVNHFFQNHKMHEFRINDDFVKLQMALAMSQGLALHLCKNDYLPFAKSVMDELFHINI